MKTMNKCFSPPNLDSPKRLAIIDAATKLFLQAGFGAVSVDAIAAQANVSKRTVYSHFEGKEALFVSVMFAVCKNIGDGEGCPITSEDLRAKLSLKDMLLTKGRRLLALLTTPDGAELMRVVMSEAARFPELGRAFYEVGPGQSINDLAEYLEERMNLGEVKIKNTEMAAQQFLGTLVFPAQMQMTLGIRDGMSKKEIEDIVENAVNGFLKIYGIDR